MSYVTHDAYIGLQRVFQSVIWPAGFQRCEHLRGGEICKLFGFQEADIQMWPKPNLRIHDSLQWKANCVMMRYDLNADTQSRIGQGPTWGKDVVEERLICSNAIGFRISSM